MQGEQAINRADDRDDVQGFENLQTDEDYGRFDSGDDF